MTTLDSFSRDYLQLTLEIDKHIDGYVDAYYGPDDLKAEVNAASKREPAALLADVASLQARIPADNPARRNYLAATLRALDCSVRMLNGESFTYLDEVNRLFDISPQPVDEAEFLAAHNELDTLLPGSGSISERLNARRKRYMVANDQALRLLELARDEARRRTKKLFDLPDDEDVKIELTRNQPWAAYNWYLGNGRSLIEFNTDTPISALGLLSTFAHEGYPGHHTEAILKEQILYHQKGYGEQAAALLQCPGGVIAEGIATTAVEIIFPNGTQYEWLLELLLPAAQIQTDETADQMRRLAKTVNILRYVSGNAATLYHTGQLNQEQISDYYQTYALSTPQRAAQSFSFISHPLYRAYVFTYTKGYDLIQQATPTGDKAALFKKLLTQQILPSQLTNHQP
ncbi:MAG: hypothetical protein ACE5EY_17400 [Anaerolineae bacterium]